MNNKRLAYTYRLIDIGIDKEKHGDIRRAHTAYEAAVENFMHLAFVECSNIDEVKNWLANHPLDFATERFIAITEDVIAMPQSEWTRYFQSGNYLLIAFSLFFAVLGQPERMRFFARLAAEPVLFATPFWGEFGKTYAAFVEGRDYKPEFPNINFPNRYQLPYIDLMAASLDGRYLEPAIAEIDRQFIARNADHRMDANDPYMIDGSADRPVKFDFRKHGLLAIIDRAKV